MGGGCGRRRRRGGFGRGIVEWAVPRTELPMGWGLWVSVGGPKSRAPDGVGIVGEVDGGAISGEE
eukprot:8944935-Pyramimonas_sp.AAC.1